MDVHCTVIWGLVILALCRGMHMEETSRLWGMPAWIYKPAHCLVYSLIGWHTPHPHLVVACRCRKEWRSSVDTTLLAPSVAFMATVSLLIQAYACHPSILWKRYVSTRCWVGVWCCSEIDFAFGLWIQTWLFFMLGVLCHDSMFRPFSSVWIDFGYVNH